SVLWNYHNEGNGFEIIPIPNPWQIRANGKIICHVEQACLIIFYTEWTISNDEKHGLKLSLHWKIQFCCPFGACRAHFSIIKISTRSSYHEHTSLTSCRFSHGFRIYKYSNPRIIKQPMPHLPFKDENGVKLSAEQKNYGKYHKKNPIMNLKGSIKNTGSGTKSILNS
ncbi:hypothetical protein VP01_9643g1, partial [Puccinia sorghi]